MEKWKNVDIFHLPMMDVRFDSRTPLLTPPTMVKIRPYVVVGGQ
jgi:hypothetical protein